MIGKATIEVMDKFGLTLSQAAELCEAIERDICLNQPQMLKRLAETVKYGKEGPKEVRIPRPMSTFDAWWEKYPHKIGKAAAASAYIAAIGKATAEELMEGLSRYIKSKPADRSWCNPATWLQQERWKDQPAPVPAHVYNGKVIGYCGPKPEPTVEGNEALLKWKAAQLEREAENPDQLTKTQGKQMFRSLQDEFHAAGGTPNVIHPDEVE